MNQTVTSLTEALRSAPDRAFIRPMADAFKYAVVQRWISRNDFARAGALLNRELRAYVSAALVLYPPTGATGYRITKLPSGNRFVATVRFGDKAYREEACDEAAALCAALLRLREEQGHLLAAA